MLQIRVLGHPQVFVNDQLVKLPTRKALLLLVYLALEGVTERTHLATLLWPDNEPESALRNLRSELYRLGKTPVGAYLQVTPREVGLAQAWQVDVQQGGAGTILPDLQPEDGPLLDWLEGVRQQYAQRGRQLLGEQIREHERQGHLVAARQAARQLTELDATNEAAWLDIIRLSVLLGEEAEARAAYAECEQALKRELDAAPGAALRNWLGAALGEQARPSSEVKLPLLGREHLWRQLERATTPVLLLAEPGLGKTRLALDYSAQRRPRLILRGRPDTRDWPLGTVQTALREWSQQQANLNEFLNTQPPEVRSALDRLLPWLDGKTLGEGLPSTPLDDNKSVQHYLFDVLARVLVEQLGAGTLLLDDLHDFDELSLEAVQHILSQVSRQPPGQRPQMILTARPPELGANAAASAWVQTLQARGELTVLPVPPLGEMDVLSAVRLLSRSEVGSLFAARLYQATSGSPLFLLEVWRHLGERGEVWQAEDGSWHTRLDDTTQAHTNQAHTNQNYAELPIPHSVGQAIAARLLTLGEGSRRVLEALSVAGRPLSAEVLEGVTGLSAWELAEAGQTAQQAGFIHIGVQYRLAHDLYRVATLGQLSAVRRAVLHRELARVLAQQPQVLPLDIAEHYLAAERPQEAAGWLLRAAADAARLYAYAEVLALTRRVLDCQPDAELQAQAYLRRARIYLSLNQTEAAREALEQLEDLTEQTASPELALETELLRIQALIQEAQYAEAALRGERLLARSLPASLSGTLRHLLGMALIRLARLDEALHVLQQVEEMALGQAGLRQILVRSRVATAQIYMMQGRSDLSRVQAQSAFAEAQRLGDPVTLVSAYTSVSGFSLATGDFVTAEKPSREGLALAQQLGQRQAIATLSLNLGASLLMQHKRREARQVMETALAQAEVPPDSRAMLRRNLGTLLFYEGELGQSFELLEEASAQAEKMGIRHAVNLRKLGLMRMKLECGHPIDLAAWQAASDEIAERGLGELTHLSWAVRLWHALLTDAPDTAQWAQQLAACPFISDEAADHHLLLGLTSLQSGDLEAAQQHLAQAEPGARHSHVGLLLHEAAGTLTPTELQDARKMLADPKTTALERAGLAHSLARLSGDLQDVQQAQNWQASLLQSLAGRPEQGSLRRLLNGYSSQHRTFMA